MHKHFLIAGVALALLAGCGQKSDTSSTTETSSAPAETTAAAPSMEAPAGAPAWVAGVRQSEAALKATIEQGRLAEVHDRAHEIETALATVGEQSTSLGAEQQQQFNDHLAAAKRLVDELHNAADGGDLSTTRAKFEEFSTHVRAIEGLFGVPTP
jgi:predicted outer membrane protein